MIRSKQGIVPDEGGVGDGVEGKAGDEVSKRGDTFTRGEPTASARKGREDTPGGDTGGTIGRDAGVAMALGQT